MSRCYVCSRKLPESKMYGTISGKRVCKFCHRTIGDGGWVTPEREIQFMINFDRSCLADPTKSGGRFKRHKG